jgi:hypothetical protein
MWGTFPEVVQSNQRLYVRAYWRFLLGWGKPPPQPPLPKPLLRRLRLRAREEIIRYRIVAARSQRVINPLLPPDPPPPPPATIMNVA